MSKIKWFILIFISLLSATGLVNAASPSLLRAGDLISIWVKGEPELTVERRVGQDGSVSMPLIGSIGVSGMKTSDASRLISQMLEDGFLKDPLVQITLKAKASGKQASGIADSSVSSPAANSSLSNSTSEQLLVEVVDSVAKTGIGNVAMMLGNKIYQSNRLGQILLDENSGYAVVIADGFQTAAGRAEDMIKPGSPAKIHLRKTSLADSITFTVVDAFTKQPLNSVEVLLDGMKIATNKQGAFKISLIKKEFGEISLKRKGYRSHRQIVDFKGPTEQMVMMVRDE